MYPGPEDDLISKSSLSDGAALRDRGHEIELAVLDRRAGGKRRFLELRRKVRAAARPDVVWAHFLFPTGWIASSVDAPLVVTAHGRDVRNVGTTRRRLGFTRWVVRCKERRWIAGLRLPPPRARGAAARGARGRRVVDWGVVTERFPPWCSTRVPADREHLRASVCLGGLTERKNVVRLADAARDAVAAAASHVRRAIDRRCGGESRRGGRASSPSRQSSHDDVPATSPPRTSFARPR